MTVVRGPGVAPDKHCSRADPNLRVMQRAFADPDTDIGVIIDKLLCGEALSSEEEASTSGELRDFVSELMKLWKTPESAGRWMRRREFPDEPSPLEMVREGEIQRAIGVILDWQFMGTA